MYILLKKVDAANNVNRWYAVFIQATLFDKIAVITAWGSLETSYQQTRSEPADTKELALRRADEIIQSKIKRGYQIVEQNI